MPKRALEPAAALNVVNNVNGPNANVTINNNNAAPDANAMATAICLLYTSPSPRD